METSGRFCVDCGLYITVAQLNNWLTPHICPSARRPNRPSTPYYVVRKEDRDMANRKRIREEYTAVGTSTTQEEISPRKRVVRVMEVGGEDSLRELQRLTAAIGCLLEERKTILHRRIHEVLQGALEEAEEGSPVPSDDENDKDEDEDIEDGDVPWYDTGRQVSDTKGKPVKKEGQEKKRRLGVLNTFGRRCRKNFGGWKPLRMTSRKTYLSTRF